MKTLPNVAANIKSIRLEKGITQEVLADALGLDTAVISNLEKGKRDLKVKELEIIAKTLREDDILYLFTYPKRYVDSATIETKDDKVSVTFEVSRKKRDCLLHLVMEQETENK